MRISQRWVPVVACGIAAALSSCAHEATSPIAVESVLISGASSNALEAGQTVQLTANPDDAEGNPLTNPTIIWTSSNAAIASVSSAGLVTAVAPGTATIVATCNGTSGTTTVTVDAQVAMVSVVQSDAGYFVTGGSGEFFAQLSDAAGNGLDGLTATWTSSNPAVATISATTTQRVALVTAIGPGTTTITATSNGVTGSTVVTVVGPDQVDSVVVSPTAMNLVAGPLGFGAPVQISAHVADASGNKLIVPVTWSISDPSAGSVSATGLLTPNPAVQAGSMVTATVTANAAGKTATVQLIVNPEVSRVDITPLSANIAVGQSVQIVGAAIDSHGNPESAPLSGLISTPLGRVVTTLRNGMDSVLVTGAAPGTTTFSLEDGVSGVRSTGVSITVTASGPPSRPQ